MAEIALYGKGGIGKSTISANISAALAQRGKRILQIGCDPKHDSTRLLLHGELIETVLSYMKRTPPDQYRLHDVVYEGVYGIHCVEAGGPEPGVGCAGRGILTTFEMLERLHIKDYCYDSIIYDVLGDVVCGGFAVPLRREYADRVYIITSGEFMSIYAANNILRGLKNYDTEKSRAGGLIFNARGIADEQENIKRFSEAVGLPVLMQFPRSDLFTNSEKENRCLVEKYPDADIAADFLDLANTITNQSILYQAKSLPDEILEQKVLNAKVFRGAAAKTVDFSAVEKEGKKQNNIIYSKNLISREPLSGCAFSGAMSICAQVQDAICVAHGPVSCAHITYQSITSLGRKMLLERGLVLPASVAPAVVSSEMRESMMIFGGTEELRRKIIEVKKQKPEVIFVLTTCPSGIIGDDVGAILNLEDDCTKIIPILTDGNIQGDYLQGVLMAYQEIAHNLVDKNVEPEEYTVNIIAEKTVATATHPSFNFVQEVLDALGIAINCRYLYKTDSKAIKNLRRGKLNLLAYEDYMGRAVKKFLQEEYGALFMDMAFPVGVSQSAEWVRWLGRFFSRSDEAERIVERQEERYWDEIKRIRPILQGKKLMVITYSHHIDWILKTAIDLKMEISFIGVLNYSQDDLFQTEFTTEIKELSIEYDIQNRKKDIARIQPDILLSNYSNTDLTGSFFTDTIPLCPQAGFLSGLSLAGRWGEFFRMNLREGWKDDAALYEKYNA